MRTYICKRICKDLLPRQEVKIQGFKLKVQLQYLCVNKLYFEAWNVNFCFLNILDIILDPRSQRAGSYKIGAVIVNV